LKTGENTTEQGIFLPWLAENFSRRNLFHGRRVLLGWK
jgi:hypothetical protein